MPVPGWAVVGLPVGPDGKLDAEILGVPLLASSMTIGSPLVGMAQGALDVVQEMFAGDRIPPAQNRHGRMDDSPLARQWYVQASQRIDAARQTWDDAAAVVDAALISGGMEQSERLRVRLALADSLRDLRSATDLLCDLHGSSGFARSNPLQRFWRDLAVGSRHAAFTSYLVAEDYGRVLLTDEPPALGLA